MYVYAYMYTYIVCVFVYEMCKMWNARAMVRMWRLEDNFTC